MEGSPLQLGDVLLDRYEVVQVHLGGFGFVYVVEDLSGRGTFAVKTPRLEHASSFTSEVAFWLELVPHPNIVTAYTLKEEAGHYYLFLEYVAGDPGDVGDLLARGRPDRVLALRLVYEICVGMAAANRGREVAHLDLKPDNVLLADDGTARVTDFSLARQIAVEHGRFPKISSGTWAYAAPEVFLGQPVDSRSDQFSLGIMAFELLTGAPRPLPFPISNRPSSELWQRFKEYYQTEALAKLCEDIYYQKDEFKDLFPEEPIRTLLSACLQPYPGERFRNFDHLKRSIEGDFDLRAMGMRPLQESAESDSPGREYEHAVALQQFGQTSEALDIYNRLLAKLPSDHPLREKVWSGAIEALKQAGRLKEAQEFEARQ